MKYLLGIALLLGIAASIYFIGTGDLSPREGGLLSIVLTILAMLATWIVTHIYTQAQRKKDIDEVEKFHRANLRTYALKAAEKVNNLSSELNRLAGYLEESLDSVADDRVQEELLRKRERIASAIHIVTTLKSVNDTSLSDWEGVIGDELSDQRQQQAEREEELIALMDRVGQLESVWQSQIGGRVYAEDSMQALKEEIDSIKNNLRSIVLELGRSPIGLSRVLVKKPRHTVETRCPVCREVVAYSQRPNAKSIRVVKCKACGTRLYSRYDTEKGFALSTKAVQSKPESLTEEIMQSVTDTLPSQPWPKGIHRSVAEKLQLPPKLVSEAVQELIRRGVFNPQINGKVYVPKPAVEERDSGASEA